jgi:hypothetical protein
MLNPTLLMLSARQQSENMWVALSSQSRFQRQAMKFPARSSTVDQLLLHLFS